MAIADKVLLVGKCFEESRIRKNKLEKYRSFALPMANRLAAHRWPQVADFVEGGKIEIGDGKFPFVVAMNGGEPFGRKLLVEKGRGTAILGDHNGILRMPT